MDIYDLHSTKPGMVFGIKFKGSTKWHDKRQSLKQMHGNQIRILNVDDSKPDIPNVHVFYFKVLPDFDATSFIREHCRDTQDITCLIPIGGYFIETTIFITQHRYASTATDDTNQCFAHVLEIKDPPKNKPGFVLHAFENGRGHLIFESPSLKQALQLYETMLEYGFDALKGDANVSHSYEIQKGKPWFYK